MNEMINWNDLQLFVAVAQAGGLAGATQATGVSAPTLSRRMASLEVSIGNQLFIRHKNGYTLTETGQKLLEYADQMQLTAKNIDRWLEKQDPRPKVKITAGAWTSRFIAQNLSFLPSKTSYHLLSDNHFFDLRKREAHLAIRNRRPTQQGLAAKKMGVVTFALYAAREAFSKEHRPVSIEQLLDTVPCITFEPNSTPTASSVWLKSRIGRVPTISLSTPLLVQEAAIAGAGICILPCFVGDLQPKLMRCSNTIDELDHVQWLVSHDEDRHLQPVRKTAQNLANLFLSNRALFEGKMGNKVEVFTKVT